MLSLLFDESLLFVERLSLLLLWVANAVSDHMLMLEFGTGPAARTYFERRVHRLEGLLSSF